VGLLLFPSSSNPLFPENPANQISKIFQFLLIKIGFLLIAQKIPRKSLLIEMCAYYSSILFYPVFFNPLVILYADYPDNKLTGANFEVYADSNKNGELDAEDELIGTLTESEQNSTKSHKYSEMGIFIEFPVTFCYNWNS
jgi:hypothetical protein